MILNQSALHVTRAYQGWCTDVDTVAGNYAAYSANTILVLMRGSVSCLELNVQCEEVIKATNRCLLESTDYFSISMCFCYRFDVEDYKKSYIGYNAIMLLRLLWLKDNKEDAWKLMNKLLDYRGQIYQESN
jgi:hypothetical protein